MRCMRNPKYTDRRKSEIPNSRSEQDPSSQKRTPKARACAFHLLDIWVCFGFRLCHSTFSLVPTAPSWAFCALALRFRPCGDTMVDDLQDLLSPVLPERDLFIKASTS